MKIVTVAAAALLLTGCMANMTPEQRARTEARLAKPAPASVSTLFGSRRDCSELLRAGEVSSC